MNVATMLPQQALHRANIGLQPVNTTAMPEVSFGGVLDQLDRAGKVQDRPEPPEPPESPVRHSESNRKDRSRVERAQRKQDDADSPGPSHSRGADALDSSRDRQARSVDEAEAHDEAGELGEQAIEPSTGQDQDYDVATETTSEELSGELAAVIGLSVTEQSVNEPTAAAQAASAARVHAPAHQQVERSTAPTSSVAVITEAPRQTEQQDVGGDQKQDAGPSAQAQVVAATTNQRADSTDPLITALENSPGRGASSNGASVASIVPSAVGHAGAPVTSPVGELSQLTMPDSAADQAQLNTARIARGLQNALTQNGGSVTLRLTPPDLGTVRIQLHLQGTTVNAQFHTETDAARSMLSNQIMQLRHSMEAQGLTVERLNVQNMNQSSSSGLNQQAEQSPEDGRSRGQYASQQDREQSANKDDRQPQRQSIFEQLFSKQDE